MVKRNQISTTGGCFLLPLLIFSVFWLIIFTRSLHLRLPKRPSQKNVRQTVPKFPSPRDSATYFEHVDRMMRPYTHFHVVDRVYGGPNPADAPQSKAKRASFRWVIDEYLAFHKQNRYNSSRYLVYIPMRVGMGDQTHCMLSGYITAVISRRVFLVDWTDPFPLSDFLTNGRAGVNLFYDAKRDAARGIPGRNELEKQRSSVVLLDKKTEQTGRNEHLLLSNHRAVVIQRYCMPRVTSERMLRFNKPDSVPLPVANALRVSLEIRRVILHKAFRLSDTVLKRHANLTKALGLCAGGGCADGASHKGVPYIGVHGRIGVGIGEGLLRFTEIGQQQKRGAKCLASRAVRLAMTEASTVGMAQPLRIFLATDTPSFRADFNEAVEEMGGGRVDIATGDWVTMHSNKIPSANIEPFLGVLQGSFADLAMLGGARHIIALRSGFSKLALLLGEAETLTEIHNNVCLHEDKWP